MTRLQTLFAAMLCLVCIGAQAQWQWIDKDGRKVFSDRAPPPDVLPKNIIKQPGGSGRSTQAAAAPAVAASAPGQIAGLPAEGADAPKLSAVDKDLADKKKQAEAAAAAKIKAEEDRVAKAKAENCERARAGKALMDSGVRVALTNAKGEREILEDAGRAVEHKRILQSIDANCR